MVKVTLKGSDVKEFESGISAAEIAKSIGAGLYSAATCAEIDGKLCDLRTTITSDCTLNFLTFDDEEGKKPFRHTAAHILAQAVLRLYPNAKLATGPAVDNGFFYDFDVDTPFTAEDLEKIEAEMKKIVKENLPVERFYLSAGEAKKLMEERGQDYKVELIDEHASKGEELSFYKQGEFIDLCAGPHIMDTGRIKAIKLTQCTGAYWRADASNKMLQRVYGVAFPKASQLQAYLDMMEEAKKRDHRKLGKELDLFDIYEEGPGFPFFLPKGMALRQELESFWRDIHRKYGYEEIRTPIMLDETLWHTSGHWDHYKDNMYFSQIDGRNFVLKPMNCPGGMLVYKRKSHSYRDLPIRSAEMGIVHRNELSGALHGLMRVRCFTQDDAHIFMTPEQVEDEIIGVMKLVDEIYSVFGFSYKVELSTRPEDSMGTDEEWEMATNALKNALEKTGRDYVINEGDGAFYGPKIDFHLTDSIGRTWQCGTIQLDFQMPQRFDLYYVGADSEKHRPIMLHRAVLGSIERFIGILTEHYAGAFPIWLAPVQVKLLPIADRHLDYVRELDEKLKAAGIYRTEVDTRSEKIGYKIREAQLEKVPYMLIVGDKDIENGVVSVRSHSGGDLGTMTLDEFISRAKDEIARKV